MRHVTKENLRDAICDLNDRPGKTYEFFISGNQLMAKDMLLNEIFEISSPIPTKRYLLVYIVAFETGLRMGKLNI